MFTSNRFLFKFIFIFFILFVGAFPLSMIPILSITNDWITSLWQFAIPWFAATFLDLNQPITIFPNGSGDTTFNYVQVLVFAIIALTGSLLWTILDRKKQDLQRLHYWFIVILRYYVGYNMLYYGFSKIFLLQFSEPGFARLLEPIGEMSPMGLAWTFIGFSPAYTIFSGITEVIGGVLLFHRRTKFIGAIIVIGVMTNVMALNYFYDVPVKIFSTQLWLMTILIALPKLKQLFYVLTDLKATIPNTFFTPFKNSKWKKPFLIFKIIFALYIIIHPLIGINESIALYGPDRKLPPLYGLYEITEFKANDEVRPPLLTDTHRWRYLVIEWEGSAQVYNTNMTKTYYQTKIDTVEKTIAFNYYNDSTIVYTLNYKPSQDSLILDGFFKTKDIEVQSKRLDKKDFPLMNRGFHWIQEYPFNK